MASQLELLARIAKLGGYRDYIVKNLKLHSQWLQDQVDQYSGISGNFVTKYFYETIRPVCVVNTLGKFVISQLV